MHLRTWPILIESKTTPSTLPSMSASRHISTTTHLLFICRWTPTLLESNTFHLQSTKDPPRGKKCLATVWANITAEKLVITSRDFYPTPAHYYSHCSSRWGRSPAPTAGPGRRICSPWRRTWAASFRSPAQQTASVLAAKLLFHVLIWTWRINVLF